MRTRHSYLFRAFFMLRGSPVTVIFVFLYVFVSLARSAAPTACALCGDNGRVRTYPCLVDLNTGSVGEIRVEDRSWEYLDENQQFRETGVHTTFSFLVGCTVMASSDAEKSTAEVLVDRELLSFVPELYCRDCREKIEAAGLTGGYALADLYDPGGISVYPITEGAEYDIRGYEVMVSSAGDDLRVTVNGYYK